VTALVLRTDQENAEYIRRRFGELRQGRAHRAGYDEAAYRRGHERGADVSLVPSGALDATPRTGGRLARQAPSPSGTTTAAGVWRPPAPGLDVPAIAGRRRTMWQ
jgi:hypothetical protein